MLERVVKLSQKQLRKLIVEVIQEQYDEKPSGWQEVPALQGIDMSPGSLYDKQFGGERQTRKPTPQERDELLTKRAKYFAERDAEGLDENWLVNEMDGRPIDFKDALAKAIDKFPDMENHSDALEAIIMDSKFLSLDAVTKKIEY